MCQKKNQKHPCDISDKSEDLCMNQYANAFSVKEPERVAEVIGPGNKPGIVTGTMSEDLTRVKRGRSRIPLLILLERNARD
jgi:hypothetical protein